MSGWKRLPILVVGTRPEEAESFRSAFKKAGIDLPIHFCGDGEDAIAYLQGDGVYSDRDIYAFPQLLISDVRFSKVSGFELLRWVKTQIPCKTIPTIVFSSSEDKNDINLAYRLGATAYIFKPNSHTALCSAVEGIVDFWKHVLLPPPPDPCLS